MTACGGAFHWQRAGASVVAALVAIGIVACGGSSATPTPTATPVTTRAGALYYGSEAGLMRLQLDGSAPTVVIPPPSPNIRFIDPELSPDGTRLAFVRQLPLRVNAGARDISADLWLASADGSEPRELVAHAGVNERILYPQWRDNQRLYVVVQHQSDGADIKTTSFSLENVDAATGTRTVVLADVAGFDLAADGAIAYSVATRSPYAGSVYVATAPGVTAPLLTPSEPLGFASAPRFSPDGTSIAFVAYDRAAVINANDEHPAPAQLFIAPRSGLNRRHVADIDAETPPPSLAWSDDGAYLYVLGNGIYEVTVATGAIRTLLDDVSPQGSLSWSAH